MRISEKKSKNKTDQSRRDTLFESSRINHSFGMKKEDISRSDSQMMKFIEGSQHGSDKRGKQMQYKARSTTVPRQKVVEEVHGYHIDTASYQK